MAFTSQFFLPPSERAAKMLTSRSTFFRSNAIMLCTVFVSAFGIQMCACLWQMLATGSLVGTKADLHHRGFNYGANKIWDTINKGVCLFHYISVLSMELTRHFSGNGRTSSPRSWRLMAAETMTNKCQYRRTYKDERIEIQFRLHRCLKIEGFIVLLELKLIHQGF